MCVQLWGLFFNLFFFAAVAELKAPGMSPNAAEHLEVLEQVGSSSRLTWVSHGAHTWKNTHLYTLGWDGLEAHYPI